MASSARLLQVKIIKNFYYYFWLTFARPVLNIGEIKICIILKSCFCSFQDKHFFQKLDNAILLARFEKL